MEKLSNKSEKRIKIECPTCKNKVRVREGGVRGNTIEESLREHRSKKQCLDTSNVQVSSMGVITSSKNHNEGRSYNPYNDDDSSNFFCNEDNNRTNGDGDHDDNYDDTFDGSDGEDEMKPAVAPPVECQAALEVYVPSNFDDRRVTRGDARGMVAPPLHVEQNMWKTKQVDTVHAKVSAVEIILDLEDCNDGDDNYKVASISPLSENTFCDVRDLADKIKLASYTPLSDKKKEELVRKYVDTNKRCIPQFEPLEFQRFLIAFHAEGETSTIKFNKKHGEEVNASSIFEIHHYVARTGGSVAEGQELMDMVFNRIIPRHVHGDDFDDSNQVPMPKYPSIRDAINKNLVQLFPLREREYSLPPRIFGEMFPGTRTPLKPFKSVYFDLMPRILEAMTQMNLHEFQGEPTLTWDEFIHDKDVIYSNFMSGTMACQYNEHVKRKFGNKATVLFNRSILG